MKSASQPPLRPITQSPQSTPCRTALSLTLKTTELRGKMAGRGARRRAAGRPDRNAPKTQLGNADPSLSDLHCTRTAGASPAYIHVFKIATLPQFRRFINLQVLFLINKYAQQASTGRRGQGAIRAQKVTPVGPWTVQGHTVRGGADCFRRGCPI